MSPQEPVEPPAPAGEHGFWHGRSALLMPGLLAAFSLFLLIGAFLVPAADTEFPGPRFVPVVLGGVGLVLAVLLGVGVLRTPEPVEETSGRSYRSHSDFAALAWVAGGALAIVLPLKPGIGFGTAAVVVAASTAPSAARWP